MKYPLQLIIEPSDAYCKNIKWESSDESVATVSQRGVVWGISEGKTTITVTVETHDGAISQDSYNLTIVSKLSSIESIQEENIRYEVNNSILKLSNLQLGIKIEVYNVSGITCYQNITDSKKLNIPLKEKGLYIIRVGSESTKIINP